jgi:hypothetical protein
MECGRPRPWNAPPASVLGVRTGSALELRRSADGVVVTLSDLICHQDGFWFRVSCGRRVQAGEDEDWFGAFGQATLTPHPDDETAFRGLRVVMTFADSSYVDTSRPSPPVERPSAERLLRLSGERGGNRTLLHAGYWVWPLPPPGIVRLSTEWKAQRVARTERRFDAAPIVAAAQRALRARS